MMLVANQPDCKCSEKTFYSKHQIPLFFFSCGSNILHKNIPSIAYCIVLFDDIRNEQVLEGEEMKRILESHSDLLDYISEHSGRPVTNVMEVNCTLQQTSHQLMFK